jgi:hypothetical protein
MKRRTFNSLAFPTDADNRNLPVEWAAGASRQILDVAWKSFERLKSNRLCHIDLTQKIEQLERAITQSHYLEIHAVLNERDNGFSSFVPVHEFDEFESLTSAGAKPPSNDIGFVHISHYRWVWPIEAKIVPTVNTLAEYLTDVEKFRDGIAAPLVGEGAVIGYLLTGQPVDFFANLIKKLSPLQDVDGFPSDRHRCSMHSRSPAPNLRLHHLAMSCN